MFKFKDNVLHVETQEKYQITGLPANFIMTGSRLPSYAYKKLDDTSDVQFIRSKEEMEDGRFELVEEEASVLIKSRVFQVMHEFIKHKNSDKKEITLATTNNDLNFDSLDSFDLIMDIEDEFDIEIPDEDADKLDTVQKIVTYITEQTNPSL